MPGKVPKTGLPCETAVDQHVKTVYAKEGGITLATGEDVQSWMTESYVAHDIGRFHQLVQRLGDEILSNVIGKTGDRW